MEGIKDYSPFNERAWERFSEQGARWSVPVSPETIAKARKGEWDVFITPTKPVPKSWMPQDFTGKRVLCMAGGGQQGPVFAALGADVTVFDNCAQQLLKDEEVAQREGLPLRTVQGDIRSLSAIGNEEFDLIIQFGGCYVDSVLPVWQEAYRVLRRGGALIAGHNNPVDFIFDLEKMRKGNLAVCHSIPYSDLYSLDKDEFERITESEGVCFGHSMEDLLQGQIDAGFSITGFYEDIGGSALDPFISTFFATRAQKG